jgi:hypothetical protein
MVTKKIFFVITFYIVAFFIPTIVLFAKQALTGSYGPNTVFLANILVAPLCLVGLGWGFSRYDNSGLFIHVGLVVLWFLAAWALYTSQPPMNVKRQLAYEVGWLQLYFYSAGLVSTLVLRWKRGLRAEAAISKS